MAENKDVSGPAFAGLPLETVDKLFGKFVGSDATVRAVFAGETYVQKIVDCDRLDRVIAKADGVAVELPDRDIFIRLEHLNVPLGILQGGRPGRRAG